MMASGYLSLAGCASLLQIPDGFAEMTYGYLCSVTERPRR